MGKDFYSSSREWGNHTFQILSCYFLWTPSTNFCVCVHFFVHSFKPIYLATVKVKMLIAQSGPTLCDPVDCSLPGSSVHGILQARILEWVAVFFSRISSQPRDRTWVFYTAGRFFTFWATREAPDQQAQKPPRFVPVKSWWVKLK